MEADAPLRLPSLSLWFWLARVYLSWDSAKVLSGAGWVLTTCVQYVLTCLISMYSSGCMQDSWGMGTVVLDFSAGMGCNSSVPLTLGQDAPTCTSVMPWSFWGTHGSGRDLLQRDLSAYQQMLLLLELLCTEGDKHYIVHNKAEEVILHEMFIANMFKISPWISVCPMWANVRLKRLLWVKLRWVEPSFVSLEASMEAPEIRFLLLWTSEYPEMLPAGTCCGNLFAEVGTLLRLHLPWPREEFEVWCRQQILLFLPPTLQQLQTLQNLWAPLVCDYCSRFGRRLLLP